MCLQTGGEVYTNILSGEDYGGWNTTDPDGVSIFRINGIIFCIAVPAFTTQAMHKQTLTC